MTRRTGLFCVLALMGLVPFGVMIVVLGAWFVDYIGPVYFGGWVLLFLLYEVRIMMI
jgi:hypothetical protein